MTIEPSLAEEPILYYTVCGFCAMGRKIRGNKFGETQGSEPLCFDTHFKMQMGCRGASRPAHEGYHLSGHDDLAAKVQNKSETSVNNNREKRRNVETSILKICMFRWHIIREEKLIYINYIIYYI